MKVGENLSNNFNYQTPGDFNKDEEKWFKYFSLSALFGTVTVTLVLGFVFISFFKFLNIAFVGVILTILCAILTYASISFEIPVDTPLPGSGHTPIVILFRVFLRRLKRNRVIYVKGYGEFEELEDEYEED